MVNNNFFETTKQATNMFKFFGILPFSYINDTVVHFKYVIVYNIVLTLLSIWLSFKVIVLVFKQNNLVEAITDSTLTAVNELQMVITFLKAILYKSDWTDIAYAISETDKLFTEMGIQLPDKNMRRKMYEYLISSIVIIGFTVVINLCLNSLATSTECLYSYILISFNTILSCCIALYVTRLYHSFETLNSALKMKIDVERSVRTLRDHLRLACLIHHSLTKAIRKFNGYFGIILLATITASFLMTITAFNELYKAITVQNQAVAVVSSIFCFIYILNAFWLCHLCQTTIDEVFYGHIICY